MTKDQWLTTEMRSRHVFEAATYISKQSRTVRSRPEKEKLKGTVETEK